jgi:four helix bundle protein
VRDHKKLEVWRRARDLTVLTYNATESFPRRVWYDLCSQIRRSALSIASNIAEGAGRTSRAEFLNGLSIAAGSAAELQSQLSTAASLGYGDRDALQGLIADADELKAMISGLRKAVRTRRWWEEP